MPPENNAEVIPASFDAFVRWDPPVLRALLDPAVEWTQIEEGIPVVGPDAVVESLARWREVWEEDARVEIEETIAGRHHVVLVVYQQAKPKSRGPEVDIRLYHFCEVRQGRIVSYHEYADRDEALRAAGLSQ